MYVVYGICGVIIKGGRGVGRAEKGTDKGEIREKGAKGSVDNARRYNTGIRL